MSVIMADLVQSCSLPVIEMLILQYVKLTFVYLSIHDIVAILFTDYLRNLSTVVKVVSS